MREASDVSGKREWVYEDEETRRNRTFRVVKKKKSLSEKMLKLKHMTRQVAQHESQAGYEPRASYYQSKMERELSEARRIENEMMVIKCEARIESELMKMSKGSKKRSMK